MSLLCVLAMSCEKDVLEPQSETEVAQDYISKAKYQHFITYYALEGMDRIKIDAKEFDLQKLTNSNYKQLVKAFETAPSVFYFDDQKLAQLFTSALSNEEMSQLSKASFDASDVESKPKTEVASEKIYYSINFWEHKNYDGRRFNRQGNVWMGRGESRDIVSVTNCGWFNNMASSYKFHVAPYRNDYCEVQARLSMYGGQNYSKFIGTIGGSTQYGIYDHRSVYFVHDDFKKDDRITSTGWHIGWYTFYKKHSYNDKLESFKVWANRTL